MQFPQRKGFDPSDAIKQVTQWFQNPAWNNVVKEAAQKLGLQEAPSLSKVQEALRQAGQWLERAAEPLLHPTENQQSSLQLGINATGELFNARWVASPLPKHAAQLQSALYQGFAQDIGSEAELLRLCIASSGAADALLVANLPMAIQATVVGLRPHGIILPRAACIRIPTSNPSIATPIHSILTPFAHHSSQHALQIHEIGSNADCLHDDYAKALASHPGSIVFHASPTQGHLDRFAASEHAHKHNAFVCEILLDATLHDIQWTNGQSDALSRRWQDGTDLLIVPTHFLIGGPPAALILGKKNVIDKIRPSVESLGATADRVTQAVLLSVLSESQQRNQWESTPVGATLSNPIANLENRAQRLAIQLQDSPVIEKLNIVSQTRRIGTGPWQALSLPSSILEITPRGKSVAMLQETLSQHQPPIWTNVFSDHLEIVLRTVEPADDAHIVNALSNS
jgi:hypothetical protein